MFGSFGVADCMFFPVLTRFRTYDVKLDPDLAAYAQAVESHPAVEAWREVASQATAVPIYGDHIRSLGGDMEAARIAV